MKKLMRNWRQFINEAKNKDGKEQGIDGKACWDGYKHDGTEDGKDKCVKISEENPAKAPEYFIEFDDKITQDVVSEITLEIFGIDGESSSATIDGKKGAKIRATDKAVEKLKKVFQENGFQVSNIRNASTNEPV